MPVAQDGQLVGIVTVRDIASIAPEQRAFATVGQVMGGRERLHHGAR